jgi:hypothetical protein
MGNPLNCVVPLADAIEDERPRHVFLVIEAFLLALG